MKTGTIIILNGISSAGKSAVQKAVQNVFEEPYLATGLETFQGMFPDRYVSEMSPADQAVLIRKEEDEQGNPLLFVTFGSIGQNLVRGMHYSLGVLAGQGCNIVVDHCLYHKKWLFDLLISLKKFNVLFVGLHQSLKSAVEQEKESVGVQGGNTPLGRARAYFDKIHKDCVYDLDLNMDELSPEECAQNIKEFFDAGKAPRAFRTMRERK